MQKQLQEAVNAIHAGKLVGMPTETVYGLAANACNAEAVLRIFEAKQRPFFDPLIIHVADQKMASRYVVDHPLASRLMDHFWPGPMTFVLEKKDLIPDVVSSGLSTVAVRCPDHALALALIRACDLPLAAPSANLFGHVSPTTAEHVLDQLAHAVEIVLDGGPCRVGVESSVLGLDESGKVQILRLGGLGVEQLTEVLGYEPKLLTVEQIEEQVLPQAAPGMLKNHYAPRIPLRIKAADEAWPQGENLAFLCWNSPAIDNPQRCEVLSAHDSLEEAARNVFAALRRLELSGADSIVAEVVPSQGLGLAINDRLRRAAGIA